MKTVKALKKLAKIEGLLSNVIERYSASDHNVQAVLEDAKDAVVRAQSAVTAGPVAAKKRVSKTAAGMKVTASNAVAKKVHVKVAKTAPAREAEKVMEQA